MYPTTTGNPQQGHRAAPQAREDHVEGSGRKCPPWCATALSHLHPGAGPALEKGPGFRRCPRCLLPLRDWEHSGPGAPHPVLKPDHSGHKAEMLRVRYQDPQGPAGAVEEQAGSASTPAHGCHPLSQEHPDRSPRPGEETALGKFGPLHSHQQVNRPQGCVRVGAPKSRASTHAGVAVPHTEDLLQEG